MNTDIDTIRPEAEERLLGFRVGVTIPEEALGLIAGAGGQAGCVLTDHGNDAFCTNPGMGGQ